MAGICKCIICITDGLKPQRLDMDLEQIEEFCLGLFVVLGPAIKIVSSGVVFIAKVGSIEHTGLCLGLS